LGGFSAEAGIVVENKRNIVSKAIVDLRDSMNFRVSVNSEKLL
ncbi:MAG: hypothetical protein RL270_576, partial [Actinomycetota bacterium]